MASYEEEYKAAVERQKNGVFNGVSPTEVDKKYGKYTAPTYAEKIDSINSYRQGELDKVNSGFYDNADNRRQWLTPNEQKLYNSGDIKDYFSQSAEGSSKYDDWGEYFGGGSSSGSGGGSGSSGYGYGGGSARKGFTPSQREAMSYAEASARAKQQLDPLYERAVENVRKERYQNELNASQNASNRGLSHSGLAADQLNKVALASQSNISDLDSRRAAQTAEIAQRMVEFDQDMALRERAAALSEYLGVEGLNLNREQFDFGKYTNQRDFDYGKSVDSRNFDYQKYLDERNFGYQQSRDARRDAEWESVQKDERAWREYAFNNMSASQKAQLEWDKQRYGEDAAWRMYEMEYRGALDQAMNQSMIDYYNNADFNSTEEGGDYTNNYKTQQQSSKSSTFNTFKSHLNQAIQTGGVPASWAPALTELVGRESSWNPKAKNPNSTAHGYGQFLKSTRSNYEKKTGLNYDDPVNQLVMMAQYVKDRYGTPEKALQFWDANRWY
jgi:hypothetical protein